MNLKMLTAALLPASEWQRKCLFGFIYFVALSTPDALVLLGDTTYQPGLRHYTFFILIGALAPLVVQTWPGVAVLLLLLLIQYTQFAYHNVFGIFFGHSEILLLHSEAKDILAGTAYFYHRIVPPLLVMGLAIALVLFFHCRLQRSRSLLVLTATLLALYAVLEPVHKILIENKWSSAKFNPDMRWEMIKNGFYAVYFYGLRSLPIYLSGEHSKNRYQPYQVTDVGQGQPVSVILILGESMNPKRMSLFGHDRDTTPGLAKLVAENRGAWHEMVSSGVSTRVAVPMLLNNVREPDNYGAYSGGHTNLFRFAKARGYQTAFVSSQEMDGISNWVGIRYIDHWRDAISHPLKEEVPDQDLLKAMQLPPVDYTHPYFLVVSPRVAHVPYGRHVPRDFMSPSRANSRTDQLVREYDDAVAYFDYVISTILRDALAKTPGPAAVFIVSDHGQRIAEGDGKFGHATLNLNSARTPFIYFSRNAPAWSQKVATSCPQTHYDFARLLSELLGFKVDNPNDTDGLRFVNGVDIRGLAGYLPLVPAEVPYIKPCHSS